MVKSNGREVLVEVSVLVRECAVGRIRDAERELLVQSGRADRAADLHVVRAQRHREVGFDAHIRQRAILTDRGGRVVERIGAWQIREMVLTNEAVRGEQRVRANDARVARRDVERADVLMLRLVDADRTCSARRIPNRAACTFR